MSTGSSAAPARRPRGRKRALQGKRLGAFLTAVAYEPAVPVADIAKRFGISPSTAFRYLREARQHTNNGGG